MFNHRSFNLVVVIFITASAVAGLAAALNTRIDATGTLADRFAPLDWYMSHDHAVPTGNESTATDAGAVAINAAPRSPLNPAYAGLKDRQLERTDLDVSGLSPAALSPAARYAQLKAQQLEQAEAALVNAATNLTAAERYAAVKDAQMAEWDNPQIVTTRRSTQYQNFKDNQLETGSR